jgi:hypothetical protein
MGPEQFRTSKDRVKNKKSRKAALYAEIAALNNERNEMLPALAKKHGLKTKMVQQRMAAASTYKKSARSACTMPSFTIFPSCLTKAGTLFSLWIHVAWKANSGLKEGERLSLHELREHIPSHPTFQNISVEFKQKLKADLLASWARRVKGARSTNKAAALDARYTMRRISSEVHISFLNIFGRL